MKTETEIAACLLAYCDAAFIPYRGDVFSSYYTVIQERRQQFQPAGIVWASSMLKTRLGGADRKQVERLTREMAKDGVIVPLSQRGNRARGLRLTVKGDDQTRALVGLPTFADSVEIMRRIRELQADPEGVDRDGIAWARETAVGDFKMTSRQLKREMMATEDALLPALVRGLAVSNRDIAGHAFYGLTGSGLAHLADLDDNPDDQPDPPKLPKEDEEARVFYFNRLKDATTSMQSSEPTDPREIGMIPLPGSVTSFL